MFQLQEGMQLYIQKKILLQRSIYYFRCKQVNVIFPLLLTFFMLNADNTENIILQLFDPVDLFYASLAWLISPENDISVSVLPLKLCFLFILESSIYRYCPQSISQILKWFSRKQFGKYICCLLFCWYILPFYYLLSHLFSEKMIFGCDMFSF